MDWGIHTFIFLMLLSFGDLVNPVLLLKNHPLSIVEPFFWDWPEDPPDLYMEDEAEADEADDEEEEEEEPDELFFFLSAEDDAPDGIYMAPSDVDWWQ